MVVGSSLKRRIHISAQKKRKKDTETVLAR